MNSDNQKAGESKKTCHRLVEVTQKAERHVKTHPRLLREEEVTLRISILKSNKNNVLLEH